MCGIAGYIGQISNPSDCLSQMAQAINRRGQIIEVFGQ